MFSNKKQPNSDISREEEEVATVFGPETEFEGTVSYETSLKILGKFTGTIETDGLLVIGEGAIVDADVRVGNIIIRGYIKGYIEATNATKMLSTGEIHGDIRTGRLKIADGVVWEGRCEMIN
ncbi:MAG: bactofilin family protein [Spirochaetota bacterium]